MPEFSLRTMWVLGSRVLALEKQTEGNNQGPLKRKYEE